MKAQFLKALGEADILYVAEAGTYLSSFATAPDKGVLTFDWTNDEGESEDVIIPEESLDQITLVPGGFQVLDQDDEPIVLAPYKLQPLF